MPPRGRRQWERNSFACYQVSCPRKRWSFEGGDVNKKIPGVLNATSHQGAVDGQAVDGSLSDRTKPYDKCPHYGQRAGQHHFFDDRSDRGYVNVIPVVGWGVG